jgi:hypothetical protein
MIISIESMGFWILFKNTIILDQYGYDSNSNPLYHKMSSMMENII